MKFKNVKQFALIVFGILGLGFIQNASATIIGAVGITATNSHPDPFFGTAENLINQGGLETGYTSGVTDFNTYIASDPQHTVLSENAEWFTDFGDTSAVLIFDLGSVMVIDGLAAWVDEHWGAGTIDVAVSTDGVLFDDVGGFNPTDWPTASTGLESYGADVFSFFSVSAQYIQLTLSNCPQPNSVAGGGCGMGEVAFRQGEISVPEPATILMLGLGLAFAGFSSKRATS